ncbi:MAG: hypothetical protein CMK09_10750 [Ponticaulis sp.]|nr:hypothetical protein [Ponticaulis sp.]|tara:strand:- start:26107 stop:26712 length:606 start_codon:yes stop_codon:yes gene_type:complete
MTVIRQGVTFIVMLLALAGVQACDLSDRIDPQANRPGATPTPQATSSPTEESADINALPEPVAAKRDEILEVMERNSIRRMVNLADDFDGFRSNYGDLRHYDHWYILKRAGIDPIVETQRILAEPYGVKDFGAEKYYIWPSFAARQPSELAFSRLTFAERAKLQELLGEDGMERLQNGEAYPGFRLAIRQDGVWVYLLQDN